MDALVLACSQAKRDPLTLPHTMQPVQVGEVGLAHDNTDAPKAPAVLVYDGPHWRIVRRWNPRLRVFALSGHYGLFDARLFPIRSYNVKMPAEPDRTWLYYRVLFGAKPTFQPFDTIWTCVPGGGYARVVNLLAETLRAGGCTARFAPVVELLEADDRDLPAHFARTRALSLLCQQHEQGRMPEPTTLTEWEALVLAGEVL